MRKTLCKNKKKRETARVSKERTFDETAKVGTSVPLKQTARERTQEPQEIQSKGGEFKKSRRKRSGRRGRKRR